MLLKFILSKVVQLKVKTTDLIPVTNFHKINITSNSTFVSHIIDLIQNLLKNANIQISFAAPSHLRFQVTIKGQLVSLGF